MNYSYNQTILTGRLTKNPEHKVFESGKENLRFTIATNRPFKNKETNEYDVDYIPITLWGASVNAAKILLKKGSPILVWGRLQIQEYQKTETEKGWRTEIIAENFQVLESLKQYENRIESQKQREKEKD